MLTVDYTTLASNSTLDFNVKDFPLAVGEVFLTDNLSIRDVTGQTAPPGSLRPPLRESVIAEPLKPVVYPTPFRSAATLNFSTSRSGILRVDVIDLAGRRVRRLMDETDAGPGLHLLTITANSGGERLDPGIYFYRIEAAEGVRTGRFVVLR